MSDWFPLNLEVPLIMEQSSNSSLKRPQREECHDGFVTIISIQNTASDRV